MPKGKRTGPGGDHIRSMTDKGAAAYPGETVKGTYGDCSDSAMMAGQGSSNLSPPGSEGMGAPMTGSGLPPARGIELGMRVPPTGMGTLPPGPNADPGLRAECGLPPGPNADPGMPAASPLPPGPSDLDQGDPETGITPAGPPL